MTRSGKEPAEDVKRRLIEACKEVGQKPKGMMRLCNDVRVIVVTTDAFDVIALVPISGEWPDFVRVVSGTPDGIHGPFMHGRSQVALSDLNESLLETIDEREKVISAMQLGVEGPYRFENSEWKNFSLP